MFLVLYLLSKNKLPLLTWYSMLCVLMLYTAVSYKKSLYNDTYDNNNAINDFHENVIKNPSGMIFIKLVYLLCCSFLLYRTTRPNSININLCRVGKVND